MPRSVSSDFWDHLQALVDGGRVVIDRPGGSRHPDDPARIYTHDYGYLAGSSSQDGGGLDVWVGAGNGRRVVAVLCTVDPLKRDAEIKILLDCSEEEMAAIFAFQDTESMGCMLIQRHPNDLIR